MDGREMHCPRGKVLGGSSSINGMVYVRGHARDFDQWEARGAAGWAYRDCLPYFRKTETWSGGGDEYRGGDGPLATCDGNAMANPLYRAFIQAGEQAGYPKTADYNGFQQEGFGAMHMTVKDGVRASTANAYLRPAMPRPNLKVVTQALTRRVVLDGKRAVGVEYARGGRSAVAAARREVILSAGSIGSPQLLQLSGIGPGAVLRDAGVEVVHDLPGGLFPVPLQPADHAQRQAQPLRQVPDRGALVLLQVGPGGDQPFRILRLHPLARRGRVAGYSVPLPARRHALRRQRRLRRPRLPGPRRPEPAEEPRVRPDRLVQAGGQAPGALQLPGGGRGPGGLPRLHPPDP
jgi:hypothetical protein